ncbi:MAG: hypothetical protein BRD30_06690 [Bacteroidetes bacterium QH_2_63_10]|nr:MAG: hypothetical protein BRD30_06690 [Bacteroidetes bacterium QH_2_63_10]
MSEPVQFYLDEHIPSAVAEGVRHRGVDVMTLDEANMLGARDEEHLAFGREENCVLVTHDDDFLRLAAEGISHAGIVYIPRERTIGDMVRGLVVLAHVFSEEGTDDRVEFL